MASKPSIAPPSRGAPLKADLPTMYDLPSEDPKEPGLPDDFHNHQPQLLRETFSSSAYPPEQVYIAIDLNLYFDLEHLLWHKRPDWFVALGAPAPRDQQDLRLSYVIWQEKIVPAIVIELLSPGTKEEDLGETTREPGDPPTKWEVYEEILKIPYYVVYNRYTGKLRIFRLTAGRYNELLLPNNRLWFEQAGLGLGLWSGVYNGIEGQWLRWYDGQDNWIETHEEREQRERRARQQAEQREQRERRLAEQERQRAKRADRQVKQEQQRAEQEYRRAEQAEQRITQERQYAEQERQRADQLAAKLKALGIEPDDI